MQTHVAHHVPVRRPPWYAPLLAELHLSWKFISGDFSASIAPAMLFGAAAWNSSALPLNALGWAIVQSFVYFWLYISIFCLANQYVGIEEDRHNKPHRPLIAGLVTPRGVLARWCVLMIAYTIFGWALGVLKWTLIWQATSILHNFGGWDKRWYTKNFSMWLGVVAMLGAAWEIVRPLTPIAMQWTIVLACVVLVLVVIQDLRDMPGDRANGRRTFALVYGEARTRKLMALCFALLPVVVHVWLMQPLGMSLSVALSELGLALISLVISARLLVRRSITADHHTYMLLTYWYCLALLSAIIVM